MTIMPPRGYELKGVGPYISNDFKQYIENGKTNFLSTIKIKPTLGKGKIATVCSCPLSGYRYISRSKKSTARTFSQCIVEENWVYPQQKDH